MAQITKRGATQSIFGKTALQELLPFDRTTEMQCWCYVPLWALMGAPGGIGLSSYIILNSYLQLKSLEDQTFKWVLFESSQICKFNPMPPGAPISAHKGK